MMDQSRSQTAIRLCASLLVLVGITLFYRNVVTDVNTTTVALTLLLAILGVATAWGLLEAIVSSFVGMLFFNLFFLPPVGTLTIADPQNWVALFAFLVTAIVASQLSTSARKRAMEATRRQREMEKLYDLSRSLLLLDTKAGAAGQVAFQISRVFDL